MRLSLSSAVSGSVLVVTSSFFLCTGEDAPEPGIGTDVGDGSSDEGIETEESGADGKTDGIFIANSSNSEARIDWKLLLLSSPSSVSRLATVVLPTLLPCTLLSASAYV